MYRYLTVLACSSLLAVGNLTHAATRDEQTSACGGDALHFCITDIPNAEKITACMKRHMAQLSPSCRAMFNKDTSSTETKPAADKQGG